MPEFNYELKIPHERVAVLIGVEGRIKKEIEDITKTSIKVDSEEGDIFISGNDALGLYSAREIVQAIGRGFNPETAKCLTKGDYCFEIISLVNYCRNQSDEQRLKGRVIGRDGKSRRLIEELTMVSISVYGKTISIIGEASRVMIARKAIDSLLQGSTHAKVFKWLEAQRRQLKRGEML